MNTSAPRKSVTKPIKTSKQTMRVFADCLESDSTTQDVPVTRHMWQKKLVCGPSCVDPTSWSIQCTPHHHACLPCNMSIYPQTPHMSNVPCTHFTIHGHYCIALLPWTSCSIRRLQNAAFAAHHKLISENADMQTSQYERKYTLAYLLWTPTHLLLTAACTGVINTPALN